MKATVPSLPKRQDAHYETSRALTLISYVAEPDCVSSHVSHSSSIRIRIQKVGYARRLFLDHTAIISDHLNRFKEVLL